MNIKSPGVYHIYNRGNNNQPVFFSEENYYYFLRKCHHYLKPTGTILCWCLMPTHFHFLINTTEKSFEIIRSGNIEMPAIVNAFRLLQSSYAKGINQQQHRTGSLFQQKTKAKLVSGESDYSLTAFHYIHQNPYSAGLVKQLEEWPFSSYPDYAGLRNGTLCEKELAIELLGLSRSDFKIESYKNINNEDLKFIF